MNNKFESIKTNIVKRTMVYIFILSLFFILAIFFLVQDRQGKIRDSILFETLDVEIELIEQWIDSKATMLEKHFVIEDLQSEASIFKALSLYGKSASDTIEVLYFVDANLNYYDNYYNKEIVSTDDKKITSLLSGQNHKIVTSLVKSPKEARPSINILVPLKDTNGIIGVVGAIVYTEELNIQLKSINIYGGGYGGVINSEGRIIIHPNPDLILDMTLDNSKEYGFFDLDKVQYTIFNNDIGKGKYKNKEGVRKTIYFKKTKISDGWIAILTTVDDSMQNMYEDLVIPIALILIVIFLSAYFFSRGLADFVLSPIKALNRVVSIFNSGNRGIRAKASRNDELGNLANSFNTMADMIIDYTENLEDLITERTQVLAGLNNEIINKNKELRNMNTELTSTNDRLHVLATTDSLTGLMNRHEFLQRVQRAIDLYDGSRARGFSILFIDLDNFKYYNDNFSHDVGDYILKEVSKILEANIRDLDFACRYGGDEFTIMLNQSNGESAKMISERIHMKLIEKDGFVTELSKMLNEDVEIARDKKLTCSIGIVNYIDSRTGAADELLNLADETMYRAKRLGKSKIIVYGEDFN